MRVTVSVNLKSKWGINYIKRSVTLDYKANGEVISETNFCLKLSTSRSLPARCRYDSIKLFNLYDTPFMIHTLIYNTVHWPGFVWCIIPTSYNSWVNLLYLIKRSQPFFPHLYLLQTVRSIFDKMTLTLAR